MIYKFSPGFLAYGSGHHGISFPDYVQDMTEEQRAVMKHPHMRSP